MSETPYIAPEPYPPSGGSKTAMILGIIGTVIGALGICGGILIACIGWIAGIAALALGIIALVRAKMDVNPQTAKLLGIVAIVLGALVLLISCGNSAIGAYLASQGYDWQTLLRQFQ